MAEQLWWLNRPLCLEWPEGANVTPSEFRWLVELVCGIRHALAPRRASAPHPNRRADRTRAGIASGRGWQAATHRRRNV